MRQVQDWPFQEEWFELWIHLEKNNRKESAGSALAPAHSSYTTTGQVWKRIGPKRPIPQDPNPNHGRGTPKLKISVTVARNAWSTWGTWPRTQQDTKEPKLKLVNDLAGKGVTTRRPSLYSMLTDILNGRGGKDCNVSNPSHRLRWRGNGVPPIPVLPLSLAN